MSSSLIIKNTITLYFRMIITIVVGLFTSRVVLQVLGVEDYGIYCLVAGFVAMFAFLRGSLQTSASRFFAFEIGRGIQGNVRRYFRSVFTLHLFVVPVLFFALETIGLFLIRTKLNIPAERLPATTLVFHFSVINTCMSVLRIPIVALVLAYEKMGIYAYMSILEVMLKVILAVAISYSPYDKLITYAALLTFSPLILFLLFHIYCCSNFPSYCLRPLYKNNIIRVLFGYTGWSFLGSFAHIMKMQGVSILLNLFFGPAVNAARAITLQVINITLSLSQNFTVALNPQITKNYSAGNLDAMFKLMMWGAKLSFFLMFFFSLPVLFETKLLLHLWLGDVPDHTVSFVRILLVDSLLSSFAYVMAASIQATGKIRLYQLVVGGLVLANVPVCYIVLRLGYPPVSTAVVSVTISAFTMFARVGILKLQIPQFPIWTFVREVFGRSTLVILTAVLLPMYVNAFHLEGLRSLFAIGLVSVCSVSIFIWVWGMSLTEKKYIAKTLRVRLKGAL